MISSKIASISASPVIGVVKSKSQPMKRYPSFSGAFVGSATVAPALTVTVPNVTPSTLKVTV